MQKYWVLGIATAQVGVWEIPINGHWTGRSTPTIGVLNTSALSTISSYGSISISIYPSSIVTNEDKTWYVSFYLLLANSMTAFNNQQYRVSKYIQGRI